MLRFIFRILGFFFVIALAVIGLKMAAPIYYGNPILLEKVNFMSGRDGVEAVFLGSSRTYRHIVPTVFSEISAEKISAVNFGAGGTFGIEVLRFAEGIVDDHRFKNLRYVFIELQLPEVIDDSNRHAIRSKYYLDWKRLRIVEDFVRYYFPEEFQPLTTNFREAFFEQMFGIGLLRAKLNALIPQGKRNRYVGPDGDGFVSLDLELGRERGKGSYYARQQAFLVDLSEGSVTVGMESDELDNHDRGRTIGRLYPQAHLDLLDDFQSRGMQVYFFRPPDLTGRNNAGLSELQAKLPQESLFDFSNVFEYPELYKKEYYFDRGHFNEEGARAFSKVFAEAFNRRVSE